MEIEAKRSALTLEQFRSSFEAGGLFSVGVIASGSQFFVTAERRSGSGVTLATTHGRRFRAFRNPAQAIALLHRMGAQRIAVDTTAWSPAEAPSEERKRPDTAARQRRAHAAAAHDAWFLREVEAALQEADDPDAVWVSNEEANRQAAEHRAMWLAHPAE